MDSPVPELPAEPLGRFRCAIYSCVLSGRACVLRQLTLKRSRVHPTQVARIYAVCGSGRCLQGQAVAAVVGEVEAPEVRMAADTVKMPGAANSIRSLRGRVRGE